MRIERSGLMPGLGQDDRGRLPPPTGLFPPVRPPGPPVEPLYPQVPPLLPQPSLPLPLPVTAAPRSPYPQEWTKAEQEKALKAYSCERAAKDFVEKCRQLEWVREDLAYLNDLISSGTPVPGGIQRISSMAEFLEDKEEELLEDLNGLASQLDECGCKWSQKGCWANCGGITYEPYPWTERIVPYDPGGVLKFTEPTPWWSRGLASGGKTKLGVSLGAAPSLGQLRPGAGFFDPLGIPPAGSHLIVFVNDAETDGALPGATITAVIPTYDFRQVVAGGAEGVAEFRFSVPPGPVTVYVTAPGYAPAEATLESVGAKFAVDPRNIVRLKRRNWVGPLLGAVGLAALGIWYFG